MIRVLSLDPGLTTGFATGEIEAGKMKTATGQQKWDHEDLWRALGEFSPNHVVMERFEYRRNRNRDNLELYPRELIGVTTVWCSINGIRLHFQTASQAMNHFTDMHLKNDGLYVPGKPHAMDALRHLLQWYVFGFGYQFNEEGYVSS